MNYIKKRALPQQLFTRHFAGECAGTYKTLCLMKPQVKVHEELGQTRMARDIVDVCKVEHYIQNHCQDPFNLHEVPELLVNIVSGQIVTEVVEKSLSSLGAS